MSEQGKRGWQGQGRRGRPNRDRPDIDRGTPELRAHRERLAAGGDPALSEYPLGLLLARGLVSREQHEAGCYYAFLYGRSIGRTQVNCSYLFGAQAAGYADRHDLTEADLAKLQSLFRQGKIVCWQRAGASAMPPRTSSSSAASRGFSMASANVRRLRGGPTGPSWLPSASASMYCSPAMARGRPPRPHGSSEPQPDPGGE